MPFVLKKIAIFLLFATMDVNFLLKYLFWIPVLLWVGLHFWFRNVSYVVFLKNQLDRGEKWAYVLSGFVKKTLSDVKILSIDTFEDLKNVTAELKA